MANVIAQLPPEDVVCGIPRTALAEHRRDVRLVLHADPATAVMLQAAFSGEAHVEVRADPTMVKGRIVLKHPGGQNEVGLVSQFRAMASRLGTP